MESSSANKAATDSSSNQKSLPHSLNCVRSIEEYLIDIPEVRPVEIATEKVSIGRGEYFNNDDRRRRGSSGSMRIFTVTPAYETSSGVVDERDQPSLFTNVD